MPAPLKRELQEIRFYQSVEALVANTGKMTREEAEKHIWTHPPEGVTVWMVVDRKI